MNICDCNQGRLPCTCKSPTTNIVHRYQVVRMLSEEGNVISYNPHGPWVVTADAHDAALAALREELANTRKPSE